MKTTQITVRNVNAALKQRINSLAKLKAMSINDFVLYALEENVKNPSGKAITWHEYSGIMDQESINQRVLDNFEVVDLEMWKPAS